MTIEEARKIVGRATHMEIRNMVLALGMFAGDRRAEPLRLEAAKLILKKEKKR